MKAQSNTSKAIIYLKHDLQIFIYDPYVCKKFCENITTCQFTNGNKTEWNGRGDESHIRPVKKQFYTINYLPNTD
jgi:hypothetical protein